MEFDVEFDESEEIEEDINCDWGSDECNRSSAVVAMMNEVQCVDLNRTGGSSRSEIAVKGDRWGRNN